MDICPRPRLVGLGEDADAQRRQRFEQGAEGGSRTGFHHSSGSCEQRPDVQPEQAGRQRRVRQVVFRLGGEAVEGAHPLPGCRRLPDGLRAIE